MSHQLNQDGFSCDGWRVDASGQKLVFDYSCSRYGSFSETIEFPGFNDLAFLAAPSFSSLLDLALVTLGMSYYKMAALPTITMNVSRQTDALEDYVQMLYGQGMAEFYVRNDLPYPPEIDFAFHPQNLKENHDLLTLDQNKALVAFGGGKDSYVALDLMEKAGYDCQAVSVVMSQAVEDKIKSSANRPVDFIQRRLDPKLKEANEQGALNGHVPITMVNAVLVMTYAALTGCGQVVFANERSADEATMTINGHAANHQFSKSFAMENALRCGREDLNLCYFSVLRPFSELWIARQFAEMKEVHDCFLSCNQNFVIDPEQVSKRWCGECPKCAFTFLILAPFMTQEEMIGIFGENLLNKETLLPLYQQLVGLTDQKPWECVGTIDECRAAFQQLSQSKEWRDCILVQTFAAHDWPTTWDDFFVPQGDHFIPSEVLRHV